MSLMAKNRSEKLISISRIIEFQNQPQTSESSLRGGYDVKIATFSQHFERNGLNT